MLQRWRRHPSNPGQHLAFQETVSRTPVHLTLNHFEVFEAIDLPFDRAGTPGHRQRGFFPLYVTFDARKPWAYPFD